jgi:HK97 gp10 family phage protein
MKSRIKVEGLEQVQRNMNALASKVGRATFDAGNKVAQMIRTTAVQSIQDVSQGEQTVRYTAGGNPYIHTTSTPGGAPNTDTGTLVSSIQVEIKSDDIYVGSRLDYAYHLEFGTSVMQARPWLIPAVEANRSSATKEFSYAIDRVISRDGNV